MVLPACISTLSISLIPAQAGIQFLALGPRFRGDERKKLSRSRDAPLDWIRGIVITRRGSMAGDNEIVHEPLVLFGELQRRRGDVILPLRFGGGARHNAA